MKLSNWKWSLAILATSAETQVIHWMYLLRNLKKATFAHAPMIGVQSLNCLDFGRLLIYFSFQKKTYKAIDKPWCLQTIPTIFFRRNGEQPVTLRRQGRESVSLALTSLASGQPLASGSSGQTNKLRYANWMYNEFWLIFAHFTEYIPEVFFYRYYCPYAYL